MWLIYMWSKCVCSNFICGLYQHVVFLSVWEFLLIIIMWKKRITNTVRN